MKSLNDIQKDFHAIEDALYDGGGELTPEIEAMIEANEQEFEAKLDRYAGFINYLKAQIAYHDQRQKELAERKKTANNTIERLRQRLVWRMQERGVKKAKTSEYTYSIAHRKKAELLEDQIPDDLLMELTEKGWHETVHKFDKAAIKKHYAESDFVSITESETLSLK